MAVNFMGRPLKADAYSRDNFGFIDADAANYMANIAAIDLIENGDRTSRERWQRHKLTSLFRHAHAQSVFWKKRMPSRFINYEVLQRLPILTRQDLVRQVETEGALSAPSSQAPLSTYVTTGSTGTPVRIFNYVENGFYNDLRSIAQYFINNLSVDENRIQIVPSVLTGRDSAHANPVETSQSWIGPLSSIFRNGLNKKIRYVDDMQSLVRELKREKCGYLVSLSRHLELLIEHGGEELIRSLNIKLWSHLSDYRSPELVALMSRLGIKCISNYSSGEIGPIAHECLHAPNHYHVVHTNVIVEEDEALRTSINGVEVSRLLMTHLHSYASPIIRYDIGDFGSVMDACPCGHDGTTIKNIYGRGKHFLRHPNGRIMPFWLSTKTLLAVTRFDECRIKQTKIDTITIELGGREEVGDGERDEIKKLLTAITGEAFNIEIRPVRKIEWSDNPKHLFFSSSFT